MHPRLLARCLIGLAALAAAAGCRPSATSSNDAPLAVAPRVDEVRIVAADELPPLAPYSPTSDPTLEVAGPKGWKRLPRNDEAYLIGYYGASSPNVLPRIFVKSADWTGQAGETTEKNLPELATEVAQSLDPEQVIEPPRPVVLAGEPWVRYVEAARIGDAKAEKQILQRVVGDRLYTVELQIYHGKILESRDQAYAVAAGLRFQPAEPAPRLEPPADAEPAADAEPPAAVSDELDDDSQ